MFNSSSLSPADVVALGGNGNMWGGDGSSWLWFIVILVALFGGWGNNGGFLGGGNSGNVTDGYILTSDFANIERKIDSVNNGLCDGFYTQAQLVNGVNQNILTTGYGITNAIQQDTIANMQNTNALQSQLANCCCENRQNIADLKYTIATDNCATNTNIANAARDITDNANANTKAILDFLVQDKMAALQSENEALRLSASQSMQNQFLISQLRPSPIPSYVVPNPYGCNCGQTYAGYFGGTTIA